VYTHPGNDRPSPGGFAELQQVISGLGLIPASLIAVVVETPAQDPYNGPRATIINGVTDAGTWGDVAFDTIAFRDRDFLIQILHAVGIHSIITPEMEIAVASHGPAAGEPDVPRMPPPPKPEPELPEPEDDGQGDLLQPDAGGEIIVAETPKP